MSSSNAFTKMFGHSPIQPLQEHMQSVVECAQQMLPFFKAVIANDWEQAETYYELIVEAENRADTEKKQIRLHLPKSLFMPIPRQDLLNLLSKQDKIANTTKDIAGLVFGRQLSVPPDIADALTQFITTSIDATLAAKSVINELDELIETGFGGREVDLVEGLISRLEQLEHETDEQQILIRAQLHPLEDQYSAVDVVFLYKIIEQIGNLADCAQTTGDQIQIIVAR
jgi:predicted phosphate transport protein (TIGR00153 family)